MIQLDPTSRIPVYQQIKEQMTGLIVMGVFPPESRLPSVRALAAETGLNPNTIQKAYQELESEGVIYTVGGKGCFVGGEENAAERPAEEPKPSCGKRCGRPGWPVWRNPRPKRWWSDATEGTSDVKSRKPGKKV